MSEAIKILKNLYLEQNKSKCPSLPEYARSTPKYKDTNTNSLTKCVKDFLALKGIHVERTGSEGGVRHTKDGTYKRVFSSAMKGTSDLKAIINGKFVAIEIKCKSTQDKQREAQKKYQEQIEKSGGVYYIATDFQSFYEWFTDFTSRASSQ